LLWYTKNSKYVNIPRASGHGAGFAVSYTIESRSRAGIRSRMAGSGAKVQGSNNMTALRKSDSLRAQVYQELRGALRKGLIGSADAATERELAEQLGVSRTPVREALALLMHEGLISSTGRGFAVPELSLEDLADLYQIRRMLEPGALASAVDRLSAHDFRMLRQFLREQEAADVRGDVSAFVEANSKFRALWLGAVPNRQLRALIERHNDHVRWVRHVTLEDPKVRKKALAGLRNILAAVEGGKPAAASEAMLAHLDATERAVASVVARAPPSQMGGMTAKTLKTAKTAKSRSRRAKT